MASRKNKNGRYEVENKLEFFCVSKRISNHRNMSKIKTVFQTEFDTIRIHLAHLKDTIVVGLVADQPINGYRYG